MWANPDSKIYDIVKYLLSSSTENSSAWSIYLRNLSAQYALEDPQTLLTMDPPNNSSYKNAVLTRIKSYRENDLRYHDDLTNKLKYLNVSLLGLSGRHHPALSDIVTVNDVKKSCHHLKMLLVICSPMRKRVNSQGVPLSVVFVMTRRMSQSPIFSHSVQPTVTLG